MLRPFIIPSRLAACARPFGPIAGSLALVLLLAARAAPEAAEALVLPVPCPQASIQAQGHAAVARFSARAVEQSAEQVAAQPCGRP